MVELYEKSVVITFWSLFTRYSITKNGKSFQVGLKPKVLKLLS